MYVHHYTVESAMDMLQIEEIFSIVSVDKK